jgi:hypothetical protein
MILRAEEEMIRKLRKIYFLFQRLEAVSQTSFERAPL